MVIAFKICQYSVSNKSALKLTIYFVSKLLRIRELLYGIVWIWEAQQHCGPRKSKFYEHLPLLSLSSFWSLLLDKHGSRIVFTTSFGSTNVRRGNPIPFEKGREEGEGEEDLDDPKYVLIVFVSHASLAPCSTYLQLMGCLLKGLRPTASTLDGNTASKL